MNVCPACKGEIVWPDWCEVCSTCGSCCACADELEQLVQDGQGTGLWWDDSDMEDQTYFWDRY